MSEVHERTSERPTQATEAREATGLDRSQEQLDCEFIIVGAGLSGMATAIYLQKSGFQDIILLDKSDALGGTWRDNTYLGCTVDIPTIYYSFSFEPRFDWSTFYAPQSELLSYCNIVAKKYGLTDKIRYGCHVTGCRYDVANNVWVTEVADGRRFVSRYLVSATGLFSTPRLPDIEGVESFKGKIFHSTAWDHSYDFMGKRVAVIGTGATGVQIIPEVAQMVDQLDVYQRTPTWVLPKPDKPLSPRMKWALKHIPGFRHVLRMTAYLLVDIPLYGIITDHPRFRWLSLRLRKLGVAHVRREIPDPVMQEKLIPNFDFGCRRPTFSNKFYKAFLRQNVDLITDRIAQITEDSVVTVDGKERKVDAIICATGFRLYERHTNPTIPVYGTTGQDLDDYWRENGRQAFKGVSVHGYPNFFILYGPYSVVSLSFIRMMEASVFHIARVMRAARRRGANYVEVRREAQARDHAAITKLGQNNIYLQGECVGALPAAAMKTPKSGLRPLNSLASWWEQRGFSLSSYVFDKKG
jgi:cation diffusion facilitator CzcD-associated flavoprotein CzcO